jgi:hypothetical protein
MAMVIPAVMVAGAALSAYGAIQQANAAKAAGSYNAAIRERDATVAMQQSQADADRVALQGKRVEGSLLANYGAAGVASDEGSPLDVLADSASQNQLDQETIKYKGRLKAMGYQGDAALSRMGAEVAEDQGPLNAASHLLTGAGRAGSTYMAGQRPLRRGTGYGYDE